LELSEGTTTVLLPEAFPVADDVTLRDQGTVWRILFELWGWSIHLAKDVTVRGCQEVICQPDR